MKLSGKGSELLKRYYEFENVSCGISDIDFVKVTRGKGHRFSYGEGRDKHGFIFVQSGRIEYAFPHAVDAENKTVVVRTGDVLFIPKGVVYHAVYQEKMTTILIAQFDLVFGSLPQELSNVCRIYNYQVERQINSLFNSSTPALIDRNRSYWCTYKMYEIIWRAVSCLQELSPKYRQLLPALNELQKNYTVQNKIVFYAELCNMSETGFRRLFREYTGLSPIDYRNRLRLEQADGMIQTGIYTVEEAALEVGFPNTSFFCRCYKRHFGRTPLGRDRSRSIKAKPAD